MNNNAAFFAELQQKYNITPRTVESIADQTKPRPVRNLHDVLSILDWAPEALQNQTDDFMLQLIDLLARHNMLENITKKPLQLQIAGNDVFLSLGRLALEKEIQGWTVSEKDKEENPEYYKQYSNRPKLYKERHNRKMLAHDFIKQSDTYGRHWDAGVLYKDQIVGCDIALQQALSSTSNDVWCSIKTKQDRNLEEISNLPIPHCMIGRLGGIIFQSLKKSDYKE